MKKFKIPPCLNHSLSPISGALATAPQNFICFAPIIRVSLNETNFVFKLEDVSSRPPLPKADSKMINYKSLQLPHKVF